MKIKEVDVYGITVYKKHYLLLLFVSILSLVVLTAAYGLYLFEHTHQDSNIKGYWDALWTVWMAASTIGFGDFYPVTLGGRLVIGSMFIIGAINIGLVMAVVSQWLGGMFDKSIPNRVLKRQLDITLMKLDRLETELGVDQETKFGWDTHGIDKVIDQKRFAYRDTILTLGQDDSGLYVVAVNNNNNGNPTLDKFTFISQDEATKKYESIQGEEGEQ